MTAFAGVLGPGRPHPRLLAAAQWGGLLVGAVALWFSVIEPKLTRETPLSLIGEALLDVFVVWLFGAIVSFHIYLATSLADFAAIRRAAAWSACDAVWFAPAFLLLSSFTPAAVAISLGLVMNTARVLVAKSMRRDYLKLIPHPARQRPLLTIPDLPTAFLSWRSTPPVVCALTAQAGIGAWWKGYPLAAALCLGACAAALTAYAIASGAYEPQQAPDKPRTLWSILASLLLAAALSVGGLQMNSTLQPSPAGPMGVTRSAFGRLLHAPAAAKPQSAPAPHPEATRIFIPSASAAGNQPIAARSGKAAAIRGAYSGIVLRTALPPNALKLTIRGALFGAPPKPSPTIPFTGVYWIFQPPALSPPPDSSIRSGSPLDARFITTDGGPLVMEAHQRFAPPVDLACCSRIQVSIRNAEDAPTALFAGMILIDHSEGRKTTQDLGLTEAAINTLTPSRRGTLEFAIPPFPTLRRFDEVTVVFHLEYFGNSRSARVAIENFTLIPK
jgi:hypothetical protein